MALRIEWSPSALADVRAIGQYIERDSAHYATVVVRKLFASVDHLAEFPGASGIVPEFAMPDLRQVHVYRYRVIVRIKQDVVEVVAVIHGARDIHSVLRRVR
ncbi:MAG: type II toxin-antitoxin system RelE/ParE family toxin [Tepidisphaeraceae bacterium]